MLLTSYSFFEGIRRISSADYLPDETDILRAKINLSGISETRFQMGRLSIKMVDINCQRSERKKWIKAFENVPAILFVVDMDEYDEVFFEESNRNRMMESVVIFDSVVNSRWFMRSSVFLLLNNLDSFRRKLRRAPLANYFPDYSGGNDVNKAEEFILWRFTQLNRAHLNIYPHLIETIDKSKIQQVFESIEETIIKSNIGKFLGIYPRWSLRLCPTPIYSCYNSSCNTFPLSVIFTPQLCRSINSKGGTGKARIMVALIELFGRVRQSHRPLVTPGIAITNINKIIDYYSLYTQII